MKIKATTFCVVLGFSLVTAAVLTVTGCAGDRYSRSTGQYIDDKSISSRVNDALNDNQQYKYDNVNVITFRGVVQLSGFVDSEDQKTKAGDIAKHVQNVASVQNDLIVKDQNNNNSSGEYVDDKTLSSRVNHALDNNPEYKFDGVNVNVYHGTVQLSGFVDTDGQKSHAADITKQVEGVHDVVNNISVKGK